MSDVDPSRPPIAPKRTGSPIRPTHDQVVVLYVVSVVQHIAMRRALFNLLPIQDDRLHRRYFRGMEYTWSMSNLPRIYHSELTMLARLDG